MLNKKSTPLKTPKKNLNQITPKRLMQTFKKKKKKNGDDEIPMDEPKTR